MMVVLELSSTDANLIVLALQALERELVHRRSDAHRLAITEDVNAARMRRITEVMRAVARVEAAQEEIDAATPVLFPNRDGKRSADDEADGAGVGG